jgi:hypothetical protein
VWRWFRELVREGGSSGNSAAEKREGEEDRGRLHCTEHRRKSWHQLSSSSSTCKVSSVNAIQVPRKIKNVFAVIILRTLKAH